MNDAQIRESFHRKRLRRHHVAPHILVIDELGLQHGKCRADIAIVNGHIIGYEIKSDEDTLLRLNEQVKAYNDVFDKATIVVGEKHIKAASAMVPNWWGVILASRGKKGAISFKTVQPAQTNAEINLLTVAQLLWKTEATMILEELGVASRKLRQRREYLYQLLVELLNPNELRYRVRECLKSRKNWRCP